MCMKKGILVSLQWQVRVQVVTRLYSVSVQDTSTELLSVEEYLNNTNKL